MAASVIDVVDALVSSVSTAWGPSSPDEVSRQYIGPITETELNGFTGRRVYLFPGPYSNEPATRGQDGWRYEVAAVCVERYTDADKATSAALKTWLDARVLFVETYLVDGLDFLRSSLWFSGNTRELKTESIAVNTLYDLDLLSTHKLFRSDLSFVFLEPFRAA